MERKPGPWYQTSVYIGASAYVCFVSCCCTMTAWSCADTIIVPNRTAVTSTYNMSNYVYVPLVEMTCTLAIYSNPPRQAHLRWEACCCCSREERYSREATDVLIIYFCLCLPSTNPHYDTALLQYMISCVTKQGLSQPGRIWPLAMIKPITKYLVIISIQSPPGTRSAR